MTTERAEILATDHPSKTAARIIINAPASKIFDLVANPSSHQLFDGSGTIQNSISGPERLFLGAQFSMDMKIKIPYRIKNTVVAFEEDKQIAWCHLMKWRWQYELIDLGNGTTQVTESFMQATFHSLPSIGSGLQVLSLTTLNGWQSHWSS